LAYRSTVTPSINGGLPRAGPASSFPEIRFVIDIGADCCQAQNANMPIGISGASKLNLMLRVVGRRADGYHLLQTVFRFIDFGDTLGFDVRDDGVITRRWPVDGVAEADDLCLRAARLLQRSTATGRGADISLDKRLPRRWGGSSDAAHPAAEPPL
jgi:hypothetical protein